MDQQINYRVNVDDANFQAKLTQMRASMDQTFMGQGMMGAGIGMTGGGGGYAASAYGMYASMNPSGGPGNSPFMSPLSYTPPAIAFEPHYGMNAVRQTFSKSLSGSVGLASLNPFSTQQVPEEMSPYTYSALSQRNLAAKTADAVTSGTTAASTLAAGYVGMEVGGWAGAGAGAAIGTAILPGVGTAIGGLIGYFGGAAVGGALGEKVAGRATDNAVTQREVETDNLAQSFRFITDGPDVDKKLGRGLSIRAARKQSLDLEDMATDPGQTFNFKELSQIQSKGMSLGLYDGTKTGEGITNKTRELADTVKMVTETLGVSLSKAVDTLGQYKNTLGITTGTGALQQAINTSIDSRVAGTTQEEMGAVGLAGASIVQGTGLSMQTFSNVAMETRGMVQTAFNNKSISQEVINQLGGSKESVAQQLTALNAGAQQTSEGEMFKLALYDPKTGGLIKGAKEILEKGDMRQIQQLAAKNAANPANLISYARDKAHLLDGRPDIAEHFEHYQDAAMANELARQNPSLMKNRYGKEGLEGAVLQNKGVSVSETDAQLAVNRKDTQDQYGQDVLAAKDREKLSQDSASAARNASIKVLIGNEVGKIYDGAGRFFTGTALSGKIEELIEDTVNKAQAYITSKQTGVGGNNRKLDQQATDDAIFGRGSSGGPQPIARPSEQHVMQASKAIDAPLEQTRSKVDEAASTGHSGGIHSSSSPTPGAPSSNGNTGSGDIAISTMRQIQNMAKQLESSYQNLLSYAKQLEQVNNR